MNLKQPYLAYLFTLSLLTSCGNNEKTTTVTITNPLEFERFHETIELNRTDLQLESLDSVGILNISTQKLEITQTVDQDGDSQSDVLLFQPVVPANGSASYQIVTISKKERPTADTVCYSRFVPERTDDYAWENDKVAFRVYGPTAQKMVEEQIPGGTLSSGVDAWLKRVDYPVINKWYKKTTEGTGSYHEDTGEGLDNFHVGVSRGVGGFSILQDTTYYTSKNFTNYRTISTGPIRTSFYLDYANWTAGGKTIKESMVISLDRGQNLSRFNIDIEGTNEIVAGLTLHEKDGIVKGNNSEGWVSYWEPHGDSELGTAIVTKKEYFNGYYRYDTNRPDESNAYLKLNVIDNQVSYYAGFGWKKSGQFDTPKDWEAYLNRFSKCINAPLKITIEKL
ncbi:DUF4861 family protein [Aestuariibaculum sediminum]|uniref:DUF4861 domain-containing protein n=1 Tax=Aestuariibaculum sediminum TaxID=2770637 RepID=A0A8J6QIC2_9FLAO|nr:DUF4861 family protein [Aestuariibaculum sediminum]MBD0832584.1 DUF4861 domain-containing protein [Aestuariibaculum sediminum]